VEYIMDGVDFVSHPTQQSSIYCKRLEFMSWTMKKCNNLGCN
jgi:hypothetical protein